MIWFDTTKAFNAGALAKKIMTHHKNHDHQYTILITG